MIDESSILFFFPRIIEIVKNFFQLLSSRCFRTFILFFEEQSRTYTFPYYSHCLPLARLITFFISLGTYHLRSNSADHHLNPSEGKRGILVGRKGGFSSVERTWGAFSSVSLPGWFGVYAGLCFMRTLYAPDCERHRNALNSSSTDRDPLPIAKQRERF